MDLKTLKLKTLSLRELKSLKLRVEKELAARTVAEKKKALKELQAVAAAHGFKVEELLAQKGARKAPRRAVRKKGAGAALYRNPADAKQTWSGRGRKPKWVMEWLAAGNSLDVLKA